MTPGKHVLVGSRLAVGVLVGLTGCAAARGTAPGPSSSSARPSASPVNICGEAIPGQERLGSLVLLGELHGTAEIPAAFGRLVCQAASTRRGAVLVGLEILAGAQAAIDVFLASDG